MPQPPRRDACLPRVLDTSEVSWLIEPPSALDGIASSVQQLFGWTAIAILATGPWDSLPLLILAACTGGLCILFNAISETRRLQRLKSQMVKDDEPDTIHRVSIVNTLTGWNFPGLSRIVLIIFNVIVVSIWVFGALVRSELDKAWGCYSAELSIDYLTAGPCTTQPVPKDRCWDIYPFHGTEKPCSGHREASGAWTQYVPPIILVIEWVLVAGYVFRNEFISNSSKVHQS